MTGVYRARYDAYISSERWAGRRASYYKNHERKCAACASASSIHLHHLTYERMGNELDADLIPLCESCHDKVHALHKKKGGTIAANTWSFIGMKRNIGKRNAGKRRGQSQVQNKSKKRLTDPSKKYNPVRKAAGRSDPVNKAMDDIGSRRQ
jgi:hypothetical protein